MGKKSELVHHRWTSQTDIGKTKQKSETRKISMTALELCYSAIIILYIKQPIVSCLVAM
jgi:hypothetical protein